MNLARILFALAGLLIFCEATSLGANYAYRFYESTGPNKSVLVDGKEVFLEFDREKSSKVSVESLLALKAGVIYPNSKGGKLRIIGYLDTSTHRLILKDWYILAPFAYWQILDGPDFPSKKSVRKELLRTDFETNNGFDPNQQAFNPADHVRLK